MGYIKITELVEIKAKLTKLIAPLYAYWELDDWIERFEINEESELDKSIRERSLLEARNNNKAIRRILDDIPIYPDKYVLKLVYTKLYTETLKKMEGKIESIDYSYDYFCLITKFIEIVNQLHT